MDIYSARGEVAAELAKKEVDRINNISDFDLLPFVDNYPSPFDGMIAKEGKIVAAYELRTRNADVIDNHLIYAHKNKYPELLITKSKIDKCIELSSANFLPFLLIVRFNNVTLQWWLSNSKGKHLIEMNTVDKKTRRNINGGSAVRVNYLIPFSKAKEI